jgi:hypothetical protein
VALSPAALDLDKAGNLYILDYVYPFSIRVVQAGTGIIRTVVTFAPESTPDLGDAGPASNASVSYPLDVTVDSVGNLFIADTDNARIRAIRAP